MKPYKFDLKNDCQWLFVEKSHSKIEITNAFCDSAFDEYFVTHSCIVIKFINESGMLKLISNFTDTISWDEGVVDKSMKKIQLDYSHYIPRGCNKIKVCIQNKKAIDYKISIAIGLI